jgi:hypothetical protein
MFENAGCSAAQVRSFQSLDACEETQFARHTVLTAAMVLSIWYAQKDHQILFVPVYNITLRRLGKSRYSPFGLWIYAWEAL